jgi:hypothetical protein
LILILFVNRNPSDPQTHFFCAACACRLLFPASKYCKVTILLYDNILIKQA